MKRNIGSKIINIILIIIAIFLLSKLYGIYKTYYYNGFIKAEYSLGKTKFTRDNETTYSYEYSYKIESNDFNDAMFYKKIKVKPNTPYKLTCMVKTENIENENGKSGSGAQISVLDTTECSKSIIGTNDWQELEFIFDSKNKEELEIGFRLGGNNSNSKGTAWFSDFKLEEGVKDNSNNWNVACFIIKKLDINLDNQNLKLTMNSNDISSIKSNIERFKTAANELSGNRMTVEYDLYEIDEPVNTITYTEEFGYYLDPSDVEDKLYKYLENEEYDYIFVAVKLGDISQNIEIPVYDWIGLRRNGFRRNTDILI